MPKIPVEKSGRILIPEEYVDRYCRYAKTPMTESNNKFSKIIDQLDTMIAISQQKESEIWTIRKEP